MFFFSSTMPNIRLCIFGLLLLPKSVCFEEMSKSTKINNLVLFDEDFSPLSNATIAQFLSNLSAVYVSHVIESRVKAVSGTVTNVENGADQTTDSTLPGETDVTPMYPVTSILLKEDTHDTTTVQTSSATQTTEEPGLIISTVHNDGDIESNETMDKIIDSLTDNGSDESNPILYAFMYTVGGLLISLIIGFAIFGIVKYGFPKASEELNWGFFEMQNINSVHLPDQNAAETAAEANEDDAIYMVGNDGFATVSLSAE